MRKATAVFLIAVVDGIGGASATYVVFAGVTASYVQEVQMFREVFR